MKPHDWLEEIARYSAMESIDLKSLREDDQILVTTCNSQYHLTVLESVERLVKMKSSRENAPEGSMTLMGCALGQSSSLSPDSLFCGGNLELNFRSQSGELMTHTTSQIKEIKILQFTDA